MDRSDLVQCLEPQMGKKMSTFVKMLTVIKNMESNPDPDQHQNEHSDPDPHGYDTKARHCF
jgi:hypothetical protein